MRFESASFRFTDVEKSLFALFATGCGGLVDTPCSMRWILWTRVGSSSEARLGAIVVATGDGIFRTQTTAGTVGAGWWLDYGARLTLSVNLDTHGMHPRERAQEGFGASS